MNYSVCEGEKISTTEYQAEELCTINTQGLAPIVTLDVLSLKITRVLFPLLVQWYTFFVSGCCHGMSA